MAGSIAYLTLQATREGQAAHAHVHEIIAGLRELGWDVDLYEPSYDSPAPGVIARLAEFRRLQRRLISRITEYDALYIRAHPLTHRTATAAYRRGIPTVQECNGPYEDVFTAWPSVRPLRPLIERWQRQQYRRASAAVAVTPELADFVNREGDRHDTVVIPNGANTDLFRPGLEPLPGLPGRYVIFFGALAAWQGVPTMLEAARQAEWPRDVSLVIAGDGALRTEVEAAAVEEPRIVYAGVIPYADMPRAVASAVTSLSIQTPQAAGRGSVSPLKVYESMAAGAPMIVSDMPGLADVVRSVDCGLVVPCDSPDAVARAVARIASDPRGSVEAGARGRRWVVAEASWRTRAIETAQVLERVLPGEERV